MKFEKFSAFALTNVEASKLKGGPRTVGSGQSTDGGTTDTTDKKPKKDKSK